MPAISKSLRTLPCCLAAVRCRRLAAGRGAGRLCGSGLGVMRRAAASARDSHQEPDCGAGAAGREGAEGFEQELVSADLGRHWSVSVRAAGEHAVITRRWGKVGGKLQVDERNVSESKNIGWTNERKPMQVANDMAASFAQKKIDSGYRPAAVSGTKAAPGAEMPQVMLARNYSSTALGTFPGAGSDAWTAVIQPKLDGVRCLVRLNLTAPSPPELCTRQRKPLTHLKLLEPGLKKVRSAAARVLQAGPGAGLVPGPLFLDGELYAHRGRQGGGVMTKGGVDVRLHGASSYLFTSLPPPWAAHMPRAMICALLLLDAPFLAAPEHMASSRSRRWCRR
ncbi:unnamed protein product [Prorocentrum cordatum]|uniref:WGR domain-containing protein n=1 Tax=Prorocentrum cordatum TaxID=2364126 RepID=A0ABN9SWA1_9DINO|nr:unnamed protein product [Polarella glacialis]